jgi:hypothetical protein
VIVEKKNSVTEAVHAGFVPSYDRVWYRGFASSCRCSRLKGNDMDPAEVKISKYDQRQLEALSVEAINELQEWGFHSRYVERACHRAFQLGFTAVHRGEADGQQHPVVVDEDASEAE